MAMVATRLDAQSDMLFSSLAKVQHKTKSQLLKELIKKYLQEKKMDACLKATRNISMHEKTQHEEYSEIYALNRDWDEV